MKRKATEPSSAESQKLSEEEAALYDRQIRLWGVDAQQRMREARVLIYGFGGIHAEVVKNIVLAGIGSVTIMDDAKVEPRHLAAQFFLRNEDINNERAKVAIARVQEMNPKVQVNYEIASLDQKDENFYSQFNVISISSASLPSIIRINQISRKHHIPLFVSESFGSFGFMFNDLLGHRYTLPSEPSKDTPPSSSTSSTSTTTVSPPPKKRKIEATTTTTTSTSNNITIDTSASFEEVYHGRWISAKVKTLPPLFFAIQGWYEWRDQGKGEGEFVKYFKNETLKRKGVEGLTGKAAAFLPDENLLKRIGTSAGAEMSPICAIVGGILGQEIIKVLSGKDEPLHGFFLFDPRVGVGLVENVSSIFPDQTQSETTPAPTTATEVIDLDD